MTPLTHNLPSAVRRRGLLTYLVLAYAGMWAAMTPLLADGYRRADAREETGATEQLCIAAAMLAPALAALFVVRFVERRGGVREALALRLPRPRRRAVRACLLPLGVVGGLTAATLVLGALLGSYPFAGLGSLEPGRVGSWLVRGLVGMVASLPLFFGEEIGWQGFLFPGCCGSAGAGAVAASVPLRRSGRTCSPGRPSRSGTCRRC